MCHKLERQNFVHSRLNDKRCTKTNSEGSALVIAIFIIVVMSLLGASLVKMLSTTAESIAYEVLGTRAYNAAQIGIQWQIQQVFPLNGDPATCSNNDVNRPDLSTTEGLENCRIKALLCEETTIQTTTFYTITSRGECEINDVITSRKLEVKAKSTN